MRAVFAGKYYYELTEEENEKWDKIISTLGTEEQMLLFLNQGMNDKGLIEYNGKFKAEKAEELRCGYAVLKEYGWMFEAGEEELLDGTSELYEGGNRESE
jgi:hypothetical protein